jgi:hypothetical protein
MRCALLTLLVGTAVVSAQISASAAASSGERNLPPTFHCGDRADLPMTGKDKTCYWWVHSFNAQMILGAAFNGLLDPYVNNRTNDYWGQGAAGYFRRFGTRVSQSMAKGTGQAIFGGIFREDPRFYPSRKEGFWPRFGFAFVHTFVVKHNNGKEYLSVGRFAGSFSSGFVGLAWTPDPINTNRAALVRSATGMGGVLAGSMWKEFQPDVMKLVSSIFRRPPKAPDTPKPAKTTKKL